MKYIIPIVIIVLALLAANGIYVVGAGHAAALSRFGTLQTANIGPGLHFKLPFVQTVAIYDTRTITSQVDPADCKTRDGQAMRVGFAVSWKVSAPTTYFKATSGNELHATQQMMPQVSAALCKQVAQHDLADVLATTDQRLGAAVQANVGGAIEAKLGVAVLGVSVGRVLPPEDALPAVYKRMSAEAKAQADLVRAGGAATAAAIRAKGDAQDAQVLAEANQAAAAVRGAGDAEAAKIDAAAAVQDPQFFRYWSTLNAWRKSFSGGGAVVVLDKGSPFMQAVDAGAASDKATPKKR